MTRTEIDRLIRAWVEEALEAGENERATVRKPPSGDRLEGIDAALGMAQEAADDAITGFDYRSVACEVDALLANHRLPTLDHGSDDFKRVARGLLLAQREVFRIERERWAGDYTGTVPAGVFGGGGGLPAGIQPQPASLTVQAHVDPWPLSEASTAYLKHFEHRAPGTIEAKRNVLKRFLAVVGNGPVHLLAKSDGIRYRDTLRRLPTHAAKRFPGLSLAEVLERSKGLPESALLTRSTVNQDLMHLGHFFGWLISEGKYTGSGNPIDGLAYEGVEGKQYELFTDADVQTIFTSPEYTKQLKDGAADRYFIPLMLLFSGCRREEVAHLALSDIKQESGVWFMELAPDSTRGRRLKNKSSIRRAPIHSYLIRSGLLRYIETLRERGEMLLFPMDAAKKRGKGRGRATPGDAVSKWFHRLVGQLGVPGKKTLHGLRATVNTKLHEAGVDGAVRRDLLGHGAKDINEGVYLRLSLKTLSEALERLRYAPLQGE